MISQPIVVAITGATGAIYGINLLKSLQQLNLKTILVISKMGFVTIKEELNLSPKEVIALSDTYFDNSNLSAGIASGSFLTTGMVIAPCSVKTLSAIANCYSDNLISRVADVSLKERRKVIIMFRETPLHLGHLKLMEQVTKSGAILMPPLPAFYNHPTSLDEVVNHSVGRCLDLLEIPNNLTQRWK